MGDSLFSAMIAIDVIVANIWMALLLYGTGLDDKINKWFDADVSSIDDLKRRMEQYKEHIMRIPETKEAFLALGFPPIVVPLSAHHARANFCLKGVR